MAQVNVKLTVEQIELILDFLPSSWTKELNDSDKALLRHTKAQLLNAQKVAEKTNQ